MISIFQRKKKFNRSAAKGVTLELHYKNTEFLTYPTWQPVSRVLAQQEHMQFLKLCLLPKATDIPRPFMS